MALHLFVTGLPTHTGPLAQRAETARPFTRPGDKHVHLNSWHAAACLRSVTHVPGLICYLCWRSGPKKFLTAFSLSFVYINYLARKSLVRALGASAVRSDWLNDDDGGSAPDLRPQVESSGRKSACDTEIMMINISAALSELSDRDLLVRVHDAVRDERVATVRLIALLMELDTRRLYLGEGCSSLFTYCTQVLHLSEHAAYNRIETARAARRFPAILELVESAAVTLTTVRLLAPHLTDANHRDVLDRARHMSKRQVELLVATLSPRPDVPSTVRKLPTPPPARPVVLAESPKAQNVDAVGPTITVPSVAPIVARSAEVKPLAPERYKIQVTVGREAYEKLRRAQDLLRHTVPNGDPCVIIERALDVLVAELERTKTGMTPHPRAAREAKSGSRHIPAEVKRIVWQRDGGRCAFASPSGRCTETGFLEYHHVVPFASGGKTSAGNLELRAHNQYEADLWFGAAQRPFMRETRGRYDPDHSSFRNELGLN
jgi:hypothetical protein